MKIVAAYLAVEKVATSVVAMAEKLGRPLVEW